MARRKTNSAKVAKERGDSHGGSIPSFDETALSALTARIEKGFGEEKLLQPREANRGSKGGIKLTDQKATTSPSTKQPNLTRGIKRDGRGNAKHTEKEVRRNGETPAIPEMDDRAILLKEILNLGGTEEDLELVADAMSDEEVSASNIALPDKSFRKELASFVAGLGIEGANGGEDSDDSDNEKIGDGWEDDSDVEISGGSESEAAESIPATATMAPHAPLPDDPKRLIFEARPDWHAAPLPALPTPEAIDSGKYREAIANLKLYAVSLLEADANLYASKHLSSSSSHRFLSTIMSSGTLSDKVSALTLVVQESPVHTTKSFESLLTLAKKRSRGQAVSALGALKDLLGVGVVLPADRRLRAFASQPGLLGILQKSMTPSWKVGDRFPGTITNVHLISWAYEDWLKESYFEMLKVLEGWCNDEVEYARSRAVTYVYELLKEKPEQEANLLRLLVNKLGDPDKKIASRTSYLLLQLQTSHPLMKPVIIRSIETELLLRPGQSSHAKYYAINTLNQTILSGKEEAVAQKLLNIYFDQFVSLLKKPEPLLLTGPVLNHKGQIQGGGAPMGKKAKAKAAKEIDAKAANEETTEKMISAVLTGVNRAFPFSKTDDLTLEKHMDTLFRITHSSNFNTSIQALMLIEQLATSKHVAVDRFYRTLYESLLDPRLTTSSKHALYLNLIYRSLRSDLNIKRVKSFARRILQVATLHEPPFICGVLYLLRELESTFPGLKSLLSDPEENSEADEEVFRDVPEKAADIAQQEPQSGMQNRHAMSYDGRKRDPEHSNADKSCVWDLLPFLAHFHPSVSLFASRLLDEEKMPPKPDLASHGLSNFLDRFVYRNAKAASGRPRGSSIMQPLSGGDSRGILLSTKASSHTHGPVNTEAFWHKEVEDVAVDEVFFHKYFSQIGKGKQATSKKKPDRKEIGASDDEDENEDEIWQALVDSRPEVEGNSDDDSDLDMLDLDESEGESLASGFEMDDDDEATQESQGSGIEGSDASESGVLFDEDDSGSEIGELFAKELQTGHVEVGEEKGEETSRQRRKKMKSLPTFASMEDYAEMLDNDEDEDV